jgi:hypothetical protein
MFVRCEKCGKKLIERLPNGLWRFKFGRRNGSDQPVIDMEIHGSISMRCLKRTCGHTNILNYFPPSESQQPVFQSSIGNRSITKNNKGV